MMNIRDLPLDELVLDPSLNLRDRLDDFTVERYADSWERMPPITVFEVDGRLLLADGFHRHASAGGAAFGLPAHDSGRGPWQVSMIDAARLRVERQPVPRPPPHSRRAPTRG